MRRRIDLYFNFHCKFRKNILFFSFFYEDYEDDEKNRSLSRRFFLAQITRIRKRIDAFSLDISRLLP